MSLTLLDNQTRVSPGSFFPQLGGGGGGGGSVVTTSNLIVSSIAGVGGGDIEFQNQIIMTPGSAINMTTNSITWSPGSVDSLLWVANDGSLTGVSSINGASYPPAAGAFPLNSTIIGTAGESFTNVSTNSGFVTTASVDFKIANEYMISGDVVFSIGDSATGLSIQASGSLLDGGIVMQSNANGSTFTWRTRPAVGDTTASLLIATTSATPASGSIRNVVVTNLGARGGNV